jgi:hypothetical protein
MLSVGGDENGVFIITNSRVQSQSWQTKWHYSRFIPEFLWFCSASRHSIPIYHRPLRCAIALIKQHITSLVFKLRASSLRRPRGTEGSLNQKLSVSNSGAKKLTKESAKRQHRWATKMRLKRSKQRTNYIPTKVIQVTASSHRNYDTLPPPPFTGHKNQELKIEEEA